MTDGYFNNRGNSIKIITNDRCGIEDYTEWENEAEFILLKTIAYIISATKKSIPWMSMLSVPNISAVLVKEIMHGSTGLVLKHILVVFRKIRINDND